MQPDTQRWPAFQPEYFARQLAVLKHGHRTKTAQLAAALSCDSRTIQRLSKKKKYPIAAVLYKFSVFFDVSLGVWFPQRLGSEMVQRPVVHKWPAFRPENISESLTYVLQEHEVTVKQLAKILDCSYASVHSFKAGTCCPKAEYLYMLSVYFNVPVRFWFLYQKPPVPRPITATPVGWKVACGEYAK